MKLRPIFGILFILSLGLAIYELAYSPFKFVR